MENIVLKVGGMSCQGCVKNVSGVLLALAGVSAAAVSLEAGEARISFDPAQASVAQLRAAIEDAGFDVG